MIDRDNCIELHLRSIYDQRVHIVLENVNERGATVVGIAAGPLADKVPDTGVCIALQRHELIQFRDAINEMLKGLPLYIREE